MKPAGQILALWGARSRIFGRTSIRVCTDTRSSAIWSDRFRSSSPWRNAATKEVLRNRSTCAMWQIASEQRRSECEQRMEIHFVLRRPPLAQKPTYGHAATFFDDATVLESHQQ